MTIHLAKPSLVTQMDSQDHMINWKFVSISRMVKRKIMEVRHDEKQDPDFGDGN